MEIVTDRRTRRTKSNRDLSNQFVRIWENSTSDARVARAWGILERYRGNAARAGYQIRDGRGTSNVQIPRRVYMGLSNG